MYVPYLSKVAINANDSVMRGVMKAEYYLSEDEVKDLREDFKSAMLEARNCIQERHCDCVFSKEEIERLVALCEEDGYTVPRGLTREERRKYMKDLGRRSSYGFIKERVERISKNTEEAYKSMFSFSSEDALRLGDSMIENYLELDNTPKGGRKVKND